MPETSLATTFRTTVSFNLSNSLERHLFDYLQQAAKSKGQSGGRNAGISSLIKLLAFKGLVLEQAETGTMLTRAVDSVKQARNGNLNRPEHTDESEDTPRQSVPATPISGTKKTDASSFFD